MRLKISPLRLRILNTFSSNARITSPYFSRLVGSSTKSLRFCSITRITESSTCCKPTPSANRDIYSALSSNPAIRALTGGCATTYPAANANIVSSNIEYLFIVKILNPPFDQKDLYQSENLQTAEQHQQRIGKFHHRRQR